PGDGAQLGAAPESVEITFSENVSATLGAVRVLDRSGDRVDRGGVETGGGVVTVALEDLDDGAYIVAWRVVSADSHPIHGSFTFTVGDGAERIDRDLAAALLGDPGDGPWKVVGAGTRALGYGGALLAAGLAVFLALAHDRGPERPALRRLLRVAAGVGAIGILAELPVRAALATGLGPDALTEPGVAGQLLGDRVGIGMAVALLTLLFLAVDAGRDRLLAGGGVVALGVAFAIAGHTATTSPAVLAVGSDTVHVAAASVWLGGLVGCLVVVAARRRAGTTSAAVVMRFSGVAGIALGAVAVAGSALGWSEVRTLHALTSTSYGQLLIAKVAIVGVVAMLGAANRSRLVPILERDLAADGSALSTKVTRLLRRTLTAEVALLVVVVGLTAFLVDVTPARSAVAAPFAETAPLDDGRVDIDVDPTRAGRTTIHVYIYDEGGQLRDLPEGIELVFALPSSDISGLERTPDPTGPGHWTLVGDDLSIGGTWTIEVVARVSLYEEQTASFTVSIQP
ncbi:MAG TPA: copper resistance protein CopC, partial [Iamia sp.]|nr:copper resistance protein CopC [Iamia sp.]